MTTTRPSTSSVPATARLGEQMEHLARTISVPATARLAEQLAKTTGPRLVGDFVTQLQALDDLTQSYGSAKHATTSEAAQDGGGTRDGKFELEVFANVMAALVTLWLFALCLSEMNRTSAPLEVPDRMQTLQTFTWCLGMGAIVRETIRRGGRK